MTYTVTTIYCEECSRQFAGVLYDLFDVNRTYAAKCPACSNVNYFPGVRDPINGEIPEEAVHVQFVKKV